MDKVERLGIENASLRAENERLKATMLRRSAFDSRLAAAERVERIVTAPTPADLEALTDAVLIVETPLAIDVARNVLAAIADRARAPEREGDEK